MAEVDTSSYPKPQPPANPFDTITKYGQAADAIGNVEAGKAVQDAILPDGSIDRNALAQSLKGTVAGSMKAIPTLNAYETLRNAGHVADQAGLDNFQKRMAIINHLFGGLASRDNPTIQDVNSVAARVLDPALDGPKYGMTFPLVMNALKNFRGPDGRPLSSAEIKKRALEIQTMAASTAEQLEAHSPRYEVVDDGNTIRLEPTGTKINPRMPAITKRIPTGTDIVDTDPRSPTYRQTIKVPPQATAPSSDIRGIQPGTGPLSGVVAPGPAAPSFADRYAPAMAGAPATGLKPGVAQAAVSTAENSAHMGNALVTAASEVPQTKAILANLEQSLDQFTSGPGADWTRVAKAAAGSVLPESWQKPGSLLDPKKVASQEEFAKLGFNLAQSQFQALGGTGTDAKLDSTMHTSPNELLSKEGNKGIMRLLKGNADALQAKARAWNAWKKDPAHGEDSFAEFADDFNQHYNPRVFQFKYLPKADRQSWYRSMSPEDRRNFEEAADYALSNKWIKDLK